MRSFRVLLALVLAPAMSLAAQGGSIADRLTGRVPPALATLVVELGTAASQRGLPADPLIQKAIEGSAKGIPVDRVAAAVRLVVAQLDTAAAALRAGGLALERADTVAIAAAGFAIRAGLSGRDVTELARIGRPAADLTVGLRVAGTLAALGVPAGETVSLVGAELRSGQTAADLLALPGRVQAEMSRGSTPAQAAAGLARAAAAQSRRGPPPGRGQPPPHPTPPPHP